MNSSAVRPSCGERIHSPASDMALNTAILHLRLAALDERLALLHASGAIARSLERFRADSAAARFHLRNLANRPTLVAILGGTGTGKSTLVNRLLRSEITATSFRRTFTAGPVAIAARPDAVPDGWLGLQHISPP